MQESSNILLATEGLFLLPAKHATLCEQGWKALLGWNFQSKNHRAPGPKPLYPLSGSSFDFPCPSLCEVPALQPYLAKPRQYPGRFALKMVSLYNELVDTRQAVPGLPEEPGTIAGIVGSMTFADMWEEAQMGEVVQYVRGGKGLKVPSEYRDLFPEALPRGEDWMEL